MGLETKLFKNYNHQEAILLQDKTYHIVFKL